MVGILSKDSFCLDSQGSAAYCYQTTFLRLTTLYNNYWLTAIPNYNVGGVFGAGYFTGYTQYGSFWSNMIAKGVPTTFAISLVPQEIDWSWIPNAPNVTNISGNS